MKKRNVILLSFLLVLYIAPMIFVPTYYHTGTLTQQNTSKEFLISSAPWYNENWEYRKPIFINGSSGAGTNYQVQIEFEFDIESTMNEDLSDIRFTDNDGTTLLDYWIEVYPSVLEAELSCLVWVEVKDSLESNATIFLYYGNEDATSLSSPDNTFVFFDDFENNNLNRWDTAGTDWSVQSSTKYQGSYAAFGDAASDRYLMADVSLDEGSYLIHNAFRIVETSNTYKYAIHILDELTDPADISGVAGYSNDYIWWNGSRNYWEDDTLAINTWYEMDFAFEFGGNAYLWIDGDSKGSHSFVNYAAAEVEGITNIGTLTSGSATRDQYIDDYIVRKWVASEPVVDSFGEEEEPPNAEWQEVGEAIIYFQVPYDETALNWFLIFLGMCMVPASTIYLVKGGKDNMSMDKAFYVVVVFIFGWALIIGGIYA